MIPCEIKSQRIPPASADSEAIHGRMCFFRIILGWEFESGAALLYDANDSAYVLPLKFCFGGCIPMELSALSRICRSVMFFFGVLRSAPSASLSSNSSNLIEGDSLAENTASSRFRTLSGKYCLRYVKSLLSVRKRYG